MISLVRSLKCVRGETRSNLGGSMSFFSTSGSRHPSELYRGYSPLKVRFVTIVTSFQVPMWASLLYADYTTYKINGIKPGSGMLGTLFGQDIAEYLVSGVGFLTCAMLVSLSYFLPKRTVSSITLFPDGDIKVYGLNILGAPASRFEVFRKHEIDFIDADATGGKLRFRAKGMTMLYMLDPTGTYTAINGREVPLSEGYSEFMARLSGNGGKVVKEKVPDVTLGENLDVIVPETGRGRRPRQRSNITK